ncbi:uncharacterized protein LOC135124742 isoform X3 [Zophobas morio]|uniref:uncharacterized protein LOC135124742 isoform X3 n=1 Tax=Zophobas morio TaxID=2755281 RepID=UPI003082D8DB
MLCGGILFMCLYFRFGLVGAEGSTCVVFREDNPNLPPFIDDEGSSLRVDYCTSEEKCCKTGCCSRANPIGFIIFIGVFMVGGLIYGCHRCCQECDKKPTRPEVPPQRERSRNEANPQARSYGGSHNSLYLALAPNEPEVRVDDNSVTPPPSYEAAVCGRPDPLVPLLRPESKVPSYEDVISRTK